MNKKLRVTLGIIAGIFVVGSYAAIGCSIWFVADTIWEEITSMDEPADDVTAEESTTTASSHDFSEFYLSDKEEYRYGTEAELIEPINLIRMAEDENRITPFEQKDDTILIYMNGSDLESNGGGSASTDIEEMLAVLEDTEHLNVVLLTGGTLDWQRPEIPDESNCIYYLDEGRLELVCDMGEQNIGDPALLAGFLNLGLTYFPAERTNLILWNHGGGSVYGYGNDELTGDGLVLTELNSAFASSMVSEKPLGFIGFDACLMGSLETACILSPYADFLVASEEIEPGTGWDYAFLAELSENGDSLETPKLCKNIVDQYIACNNTNLDYWLDTQATLSVINLNTIGYLAEAFEEFSKEIDVDMINGSYNDIARARNTAKAFGVSSEPDACYDMVDIDSLAMELAQTSPEKSEELTEALREAVVYSAHNVNIENASGVSVYFPFQSKSDVPDTMTYYQSMEILPEYTELISHFSERLLNDEYDFSSFVEEAPVLDEDGNFTVQLTQEELDNTCNVYFTLWEQEEEIAPGIYYYVELAETADLSINEDGTVTTEFDGTWTTLNDNWVCMYEIDRSDTQIRYAIPAFVNDLDADIIVVYDEQNPEGKVAGARLNSEDENNMASKQMIEIQPGDEIKLYYWAELFYDDEVIEDESLTDGYDQSCWYEGEPWIVPEEGLTLEQYELDEGDYLYSFSLYDTANDVHYTDFTEVEY